jgi:hypothetical protein
MAAMHCANCPCILLEYLKHKSSDCHMILFIHPPAADDNIQSEPKRSVLLKQRRQIPKHSWVKVVFGGYFHVPAQYPPIGLGPLSISLPLHRTNRRTPGEPCLRLSTDSLYLGTISYHGPAYPRVSPMFDKSGLIEHRIIA